MEGVLVVSRVHHNFHMNLQKLWKNPVTGAPIKEWSSYFIKKAIQPILSQSSNLSWYTTQRMKFCYLSFLFSALVTIKNSDLKYLLCGMLDISDKKQKSDYFCISTYIVHSSISSWIKKKKKKLAFRKSIIILLSFCFLFKTSLKQVALKGLVPKQEIVLPNSVSMQAQQSTKLLNFSYIFSRRACRFLPS